MSRGQDHGTGRLDADSDAVSDAVPVVLPSATGSVPLVLPPGLLVAALRRLVAADSRADVASVVPPLLLQVAGVRASAVVGREGDRVVVLGSAGYDCGSMAPGAVLPLDAGLPVTEAVRTGRPVQSGTGPAWVALPFGGVRPEGALLLSLTLAPPATRDELDLLGQLASALGDALRRARAQERTFLELALVTASLALPPVPAGPDVVIRSSKAGGLVGGGVALRLPDGRGGRWLVVADVGRLGLEGAVAARTVHAAVTASAARADDPAELLDTLDRVLAVDGVGAHVTAVAARLTPSRGATQLALARAGHPSAVALHAGRVWVLPAPLCGPLGAGALPATSTVTTLPSDAVLLLHTDGLSPRGLSRSSPDLLRGGSGADLEALADEVLRRAAPGGPEAGDVTVLLARAGDPC